jgi:hypothetical protein
MKKAPCLLLPLCLAAAAGVKAAPPLPPGLIPGPVDETFQVPSLPPGLDDTDNAASFDRPLGSTDGDTLGIDVSGFTEYRYGQRLRSTDLNEQTAINEIRLHLASEYRNDQWSIEAAADFLYDDTAANQRIDLETGDGWLDLRRLNLLLTPTSEVDVRIGRQILTWGTGDLLFLNDLFPKDWDYFRGRDLEYVKAPSDAAKLSWFTNIANVDVVYTPRFDPDRFIDGERQSFWNDVTGGLVGQDGVIDVDQPNDWFRDDEVAIRLYRNLQGLEVALYAFDGFYKSPAGYDPTTDRFLFPRLRTFGGSLRSALGPGVFNAELAYWDSRDDPDGTNPFVENGENRYLLGYEWEAVRNFTVGLQYYVEQMHHHDAYLANLPPDSPRRDEFRHVISTRLTALLLSQNLKLSWFSYYTPSNADLYVRPEVNYRIDDRWSIEVGANWFDNGDNELFADLGQFKFNSNVYGMIRYSFVGGM